MAVTKSLKMTKPAIKETDSTLLLSGEWITPSLSKLSYLKLNKVSGDSILINGSQIIDFDTAGALLLNQHLAALKQAGIEYQLEGFKTEWLDLLDFITDHPVDYTAPSIEKVNFLNRLGRSAFNRTDQFFKFFDFIGRLTCLTFQALSQPKRFHFKSIVNAVEQCGIRSLPIVGLLCFLIGVVLAYQLGAQLKTYGANIFIVYLTGVAILREFAPLITAIILAGRTSSAFTAEIGSMKVNQEIDALMTMGLSPNEFLVLPKIIGLMLAFPLLIFWADVFGVLGSMFMAKISLNIGYLSFIHEFANSVELKQLLIGFSKAPLFALIIGLVGCYQGFQVGSSADSIGKMTTKSVVQAIFLIIIADAGFSILYSLLGI